MELTAETIAQAESHTGICAGIARLEDVLNGPSYLAEPDVSGGPTAPDGAGIVKWPAAAGTVLVLGMHHPADEPRLDWWERGDTWGNRRLRKISESLKTWLHDKHDLNAQPLPYHLGKGGLFLKDAAVLSGIGIIGRNNLLLHPAWGPRIRLRSILLAGDFQASNAAAGFSPCETCEGFCLKACPMQAFPQATYSRPICRRQMDDDVKNKVPGGQIGKDGKRDWVIKYCRACELSCPIGK
jgi:epoxyqueuosine reductase